MVQNYMVFLDRVAAMKLRTMNVSLYMYSAF
jgi:hypothetical protein